MTVEYGVYFRREDYAPFWRRILVDSIDILVFAVLCGIAITPVIFAVSDVTQAIFNLILLILMAVALLYFVVLKRSPMRTIGYRVGGVRIVGLDGQTPGYWALIVRLTFGALGPLNWLVDLLWLSGDANRQALRDKFAGTYVVTLNAQPAGRGKIVARNYYFLGCNFLFREVEPEAPVRS